MNIKKNYLFVIALVLTLLFLHPVLTHFSTHLTSRADGIFISWTIYTVSSMLSLGKNIFHLPFFHPFSNTLAYSDPFISTAILSIPLLQFTQNIVTIHNFHLVTGTIILYISSYLLGREINYSKIASHFVATIFTFSPIHLHYLVHLHTYLIAGIPLTFLFLIKWISTNNWKWLVLANLAFLYQTLNAPMTGLFLGFSLVPFLLNKKVVSKVKQNILLVTTYLLATVSTIGIVYFPFFSVSQYFNYTRTIRDSAHFAHSFERLFQLDLMILYFILFIFWATKNTLKKHLFNKDLTIFSKKTILIIALIGLVLMLGPVLKINGETFKIFDAPIPLPYAVFYYVIPGFKAFRASSRWIILLSFGLSLLIGNFVHNSKLKQHIKISILLALILLQYITHIKNFELYKIPQVQPKIYDVIKKISHKSNKQIALAEFPVFSWRMMPYAYLENDRLLFQTTHKAKLYNGVSGFTPPIREEQWNWLWNEFPSLQTSKHLQNEGVQYILVHYDLYEKMHSEKYQYLGKISPSKSELLELIKQEAYLQLITCSEDKCLYILKN